MLKLAKNLMRTALLMVCLTIEVAPYVSVTYAIGQVIEIALGR